MEQSRSIAAVEFQSSSCRGTGLDMGCVCRKENKSPVPRRKLSRHRKEIGATAGFTEDVRTCDALEEPEGPRAGARAGKTIPASRALAQIVKKRETSAPRPTGDARGPLRGIYPVRTSSFWLSRATGLYDFIATDGFTTRSVPARPMFAR